MLDYRNGVVIAEPPQAKRPLPLTGFFILAFALSWAGAAAMLAGAWAPRLDEAGFTALAQAAQPVAALMLFGPLIAALTALFWNYGLRGAWRFARRGFRLNVRLAWWLAALLLPALVFSLAGPLAGLAGAEAAPTPPSLAVLSTAGQVLVFYLLFNTEEIAWRGYALPHLQARMSPLAANLLLTAIWFVFHLPLFWVPGGHPAGYDLLTFAALVLPVGLVMGAVFNRTGGSLLIAHLLHQSLNAWSEAFRVFPAMTGETLQIWAACGMIGAPALIAVIWMLRAGRSQ